jgi:N-acetylglutamate synthase
MAAEDLRRRVEEACLKGWPALHEVLHDGWLLRFAEGHTRRANSVNPMRLGTQRLRDKIAHCEKLYERAGLPTIFRIIGSLEPGLGEALDAQGYGSVEDETVVVHLDFARRAPGAAGAEISETVPSEEWLDAHARCTGIGETAQRSQRKILQALAVPAVFTAVRADDGRLASLAFGAVHERIVCINLVVTDPAARRRGLSRKAVSTALAWARDRAGADGACLPVVAGNTPARALYRELGFTTELYRYHYRRRPQA